MQRTVKTTCPDFTFKNREVCVELVKITCFVTTSRDVLIRPKFPSRNKRIT